MYRIINFPRIGMGDVGSLTFIEGQNHIPFNIKRIYYIYNIKKGEQRGRHAYKTIESLILALNGQLELTLDNGYKRETIKLSRPDRGVYVPNMIWKELDNISLDAVCLVLVSDYYREDDYIRDYATFLREAKAMKRHDVEDFP